VADSRAWWNRVARDDASWYIATTSDPFFERGRRDTDELVAFCGLQPSKDKTLLEIGAGAGRMTHRFAELYGWVIALDVSDEMLRLGRSNVAGVGNVEWVLGSGADLAVIGDRSVDDVFSYITLQHVPTSATVLRYLEEASRVLRPGGRGALQVRQPGPLPWAVDLAGTWCTPPRAAGCGRQHGVAPASQRTGCAKPQPDPGSASNCDRVGIDTCGCCCGADAAMKRSRTMTTARIPPRDR
jgi:SAM-dependent methyltransferase